MAQPHPPSSPQPAQEGACSAGAALWRTAIGTPASSGGTCVELKSLKLYFQSFRTEGIFYEAVTGRIRDDLAHFLDPVWLQVITRWRGRGGIRSVIRAESGHVPEEWKGR